MESKKKYERFRYTQDSLEKALNSIINGETTLNKASQSYNIPKSTLHNKLKNKVPWERKMGPPTELTTAEEKELAEWITNKAKLGFPMHPDEVFDTVEDYLNSNKRTTKFTENRPGDKWLELFLKRHPDLTKRNAEMISKGRAAVTEEGIRKWFLELEQFLTEENALDIKNDASRIFNTDETGVMMCPKTGIILGPKNYKNTYEIAHGKEKESITVLCTFSADGKSVPPFVVYPYKRMPPGIGREFPDSWFIGRSDSGWMVSATFFAFIKMYYEWLAENKIKLPVLLFLDGHKSHINREMFNFCREKRILLYCLHPNATHILQPCDVGIFGPIKKSWRKAVQKHKQATTALITKQNFAPIFKKAYDSAVKPETVTNSFRTCGLFPIDVDAVDYSKCINTRRKDIAANTHDRNILADFEEQKEQMRSTMKVIESEIGHTTKNEFVECYKINRTHAHPYFPLWAKCKVKIEKRQIQNQDLSTNTSTHEVFPMDLSNTSSVAESARQVTTTSLEENSCSEDRNPHFEMIKDVAQIHIEPAMTDIQLRCTPVETCSLILNDTDLFGENRIRYDLDSTEDIVNFIIDQDMSIPLIIPLPWHDTPTSKAADNDLITSDCNTQVTGTSAVDTVCRLVKTDNVANTEISPLKTSAKSSEGPVFLTSASYLDLPDNPVETTYPDEQTALSDPHMSPTISDLFDDSVNFDIQAATSTSKAAETTKCSKKKLNDFMKYPEISTNKKKIIKKKEPMPYGLTGQRFKEYLKLQDEEKKRKEEEMEIKKKKKDEIVQLRKKKAEDKKQQLKKKKNCEKPQDEENQRKAEIEIKKKKKYEEVQRHKIKLQDIKEQQGSESKGSKVHIEKKAKKDNTKKNEVTLLEHEGRIFGKYVIVRFRTEKRMRYFVGKVLMASDEDRKYKIDFLRKKSVSENVITFVRPHISDIAEVDYDDVQRVLGDPNISKRGLISFSDVTFKDMDIE